MDSKEISEVKRFLIRGILFSIPLILLFEISKGLWLQSEGLSKLKVMRNFDSYYGVDGLYGEPGKKIHYKRDQFGFRGAYNGAEDIGIVTLGSSTVDQRYVTEGETWQDHLREELKKRGLEVSVVNAGVDGQSTRGMERNLSEWFPFVPGFRAKAFLFYVGIPEFRSGAELSGDQLIQEKGSIGKILQKSAIAYYVRAFAGTVIVKQAQGRGHFAVDFSKKQWVDRPLLQDHGRVFSKDLADYRDRLKSITRLVKERYGAKAIFVIAPAAYYKKVDDRIVALSDERALGELRGNGLDYFLVAREFAGIVREVSVETGAVFIDAMNDLSMQEGDFYDTDHNTPSGAMRIGKFLGFRLYEEMKAP